MAVDPRVGQHDARLGAEGTNRRPQGCRPPHSSTTPQSAPHLLLPNVAAPHTCSTRSNSARAPCTQRGPPTRRPAQSARRRQGPASGAYPGRRPAHTHADATPLLPTAPSACTLAQLEATPPRYLDRCDLTHLRQRVDEAREGARGRRSKGLRPRRLWRQRVPSRRRQRPALTRWCCCAAAGLAGRLQREVDPPGEVQRRDAVVGHADAPRHVLRPQSCAQGGPPSHAGTRGESIRRAPVPPSSRPRVDVTRARAHLRS